MLLTTLIPLVVEGEILPLLHCVMNMFGTVHDTTTKSCS